MPPYWTADTLRAALRQGDAHIIGPEGSMVHDGGPVQAVSEKAFMAAVMRLATAHGWKVFHPFDSRKSVPGFPDLVLAKAGEPVIYAELKVGNEKPTIEQEQWLVTLRDATGTEVYLWYPQDWPQIDARLIRKDTP